MAFFNPFRPAYIDDPYPFLARLRAEEPVHRSAELGAWVVTSFSLAQKVLQDDTHFSSDPAHAGSEMGEGVRRNRAKAPLGDVPFLGTSDPPGHTRLRAAVNKGFTPRRIEGTRAYIAGAVEELLDGVSRGAPFEFMSELAEPLPVFLAQEMLGIPPDHRMMVREWALTIIRARTDGGAVPGALAGAAEAHMQFAEYLRDFARFEAPRRPGTVVATLLEAETAREISLDEVMMLVIHISSSGNGPTACLLGNGLMALAEHSDQFAMLRNDPGRASRAVEEALRYDSPTHMLGRFATDDVVIGKRNVRQGETVYVVVGAANRDPAQFDDPDEFDLEREEMRHLSFGQGIHFCLGAPVARLVGATVFATVARRYRRIEVIQSGFERGGTMLLRGPRTLPMLFD